MSLEVIAPPAARPQTVTARTTTSSPLKLAALAGVCLALLLPFTTKPAHIDDPVYLWTARQIVAHPLDFYGFKVNWEGHDVLVSSFCENPPAVAYFLAAVSPLTRWSETGFHVAFLPFALLSVVGMYQLAGRFCRCRGVVTLMLIVCPAFAVSSTTLMCEPPLLCLWIWSVWVWIAGTDRRPALLPVAAVLAAAAMLTKYSAISLLPLMVLYAALSPGNMRLRIQQALSLLIPVAAVTAYELLTARLYGTGALGGASKYVSAVDVYQHIPMNDRAFNTLTFVGGCAAPVALAAIPLFGRWFAWSLVALVVVATLAAPWSRDVPSAWEGASGIATYVKPLGFFVQESLMTAGGVLVGALVYAAGRRAYKLRQWRDELFLAAWVLGVFFFCAVLNWSINVRSILPMLPAACLLLGRAIDVRPFWPGRWIAGSAVAGAGISLLVSQADFQQAATARVAAEQLTAGKTPPVYFCGHWGFQYYMQQHGGQVIDEIHPQVHTGDRIIYCESGMGGTPNSTGLDLLGIQRFGSNQWAATQVPAYGGGFYCSLGHELPYVFGNVPTETFKIMRVTPHTKIKW
jgi:hypothetical protein